MPIPESRAPHPAPTPRARFAAVARVLGGAVLFTALGTAAFAAAFARSDDTRPVPPILAALVALAGFPAFYVAPRLHAWLGWPAMTDGWAVAAGFGVNGVVWSLGVRALVGRARRRQRARA